MSEPLYIVDVLDLYRLTAVGIFIAICIAVVAVKEVADAWVGRWRTATAYLRDGKTATVRVRKTRHMWVADIRDAPSRTAWVTAARVELRDGTVVRGSK